MPFSPQALDFLAENRLRNDRAWFAGHKAHYEALVLEPMKDLVEHLASVIHELDPECITEARVDRAISRIYRDTRFSKDKRFYRDTVWCVFMRRKQLYQGPPAYAFEFSPRGFRYGCGYYQATPRQMNVMRDLVLRDAPLFRKARAAFAKQKLFRMEGERYKRDHYPDQPEASRPWLNSKNLFFMRNSEDFELLFSPDLHAMLAEGFRMLKPVYDFLLDVEIRAGEDHEGI